MRLLNILLGHTLVFGVAVVVSSSCGVNYPTTAFRCSPGGDDPTCPTQGDDIYQCCSDDPAALDLDSIDSFVLPKYPSRAGGTGIPLFSGGNNPLSTSGMCVRAGSVPATGALAEVGAQGCPVPCNPTWSSSDVTSICGTGTICCQTTELQPEDCVLDTTVGDSGGCFRPIKGTDIAGIPGNDNYTDWAPNAHKTHQDPGGINCQVFVGGIPGSVLSDNGIDATDALNACYRRLTTANQRGFCLGGAGVAVCPLAQPAYRDACEQLNDLNGLLGCGSVEFP